MPCVRRFKVVENKIKDWRENTSSERARNIYPAAK